MHKKIRKQTADPLVNNIFWSAHTLTIGEDR